MKSSPSLTSKLLPVPHGFSTRHGGTSEGPYASLNLGHSVGDDTGRVSSNFGCLARAAGLPLASLFTVRQVHGDRVLRARGEPRGPAEGEGEADALWTEQTGAWVGVKTADCVPLLLVDPQGRRVSAVHSGWRGTAARIAARAVEALTTAGSQPADLLAVIGPAIGPCCYEVSEALGAQFEALFGPDGVRRGGRQPHLDLPAAVEQTLRAAGVPADQVDRLERCTVCETTEFYSHRRDGARTGRHLSFVACQF